MSLDAGTDVSPAETRSADEPVAVIGLACRLPGADGPDSFWRLLLAGTDATTDVPPGRWEPAGPALPAAARRGGFLDDIDSFDPAFFGLSPAEAAVMDPRQRLMLELAWEAFEDAGVVPASCAGTDVGVFVGAMGNEHAVLTGQAGLDAVGRHTMAGEQNAIIANRVSYLLGLTGPSLTVDTGQSSSLAAVHLACESVRRGESVLAVAGGVSVALLLSGTVAAARFGGLSPTGRCRTFDADADGFARGEGGGAVLLKPLSRAIADGDHVYCVIRGTAMNNNGASTGLTRPDEIAQRGLLGAALRRSGVTAREVGYVELHGTGTPLGDRVEAAALGSVFGAARPAGSPLLVGSVKTNLGHLEGAAGIAGLIKTALVLANRTLPPSLHFRTPPPEIPLAELNLRVQADVIPWPSTEDTAIAGVSSFGMGGTNVHVVLGSGPSEEDGQQDVRAAAPAVTIWPVSARTPAGLRAQAQRLHTFVHEHPGLDPVSTGHALATTRTAFEHRAAVVGADRAALVDGLARLAAGQPAPAVPRGEVTGEAGRLAYLFPGQGSQRCGMGQALAATDPVFAAALDEVCDELDRHTALPVRQVMWAEPDSAEAALLDTTEYAQPALFALGVALFRVLEHVGVRPDVVSGYSLGELTAAHVAGVLSLPDAARLVALRGRLMQNLRVDGAMVAVRAGEDEVLPLLAGTAVEVGAVNGPRTVVLTGPRHDVEAVAATLAGRGHKITRLSVSHPFHSAALDPMLRQFGEAVATATFGVPRFEMVSTLTGGTAEHGEFRTPEYWMRQARETVRFADAVRATGATTFVELGPSGALTAMAADCVSGAVFVPLLRRSEPVEAVALGTALGSLYTAGVPLDWDALAGGSPRHRVKLPTYAFARRSLRQAADSPVAPEPPATGTDLDDLVRTHAAAALGFADPADLDPRRTFQALGFDSLTLVEFVAGLAAAAGVPLQAEAAYDHPTLAALAAHLRGETSDVPPPAPERATADDDPVVVVGMGCRLPGGVSTPEQLWELLAEGREAITGFPADRGWDVEALYSPTPGLPGHTCTRHGGFLHEAPLFDHEFFGISPREAAAMDPQQRLLLETTWEAVERAGIDPARLRGSDTGVFIGVTAPEYGSRLTESDEDGGYALTGTTPSVASGRLAYVLGLHGPAITVDTACSSSLVAIHQAVRSLRSGECDLALAGGATVMSSPGMFVEFSRQRGLAPDGRCKAFAEGADGTGWAEGIGVLVLQRHSDAVRAGHRVLAVIRGSAVNSDGASNGLAAPSGPAQRRVIGRALADAGLTPDQVDAVEAHGTGTLLGDPIEARAILATYGAGRAEDRPLWLGSLKSNIGHTQAAAGVAGVIKMVLALNRGVLPRTLHADQPTTRVDWASAPVRLLTGEQPWPDRDHPRRAAVSSFGISGTNAHLVLEQAPDCAEPRREAEDGRTVPLVLSARTPAALRTQAALLRDRIGESRARLADVAFSLLTTRSRFEHRAVVLASGAAEASDRLLEVAGEEPSEAVVRGVAGTGLPVVFVFPGQGSQWQGMAVELLDSSPVFLDAITGCERALSPWVDWSLVAVLRGEPGAPGLDRVDVVQPVLFAVMVSLAALWRAAGVGPAAVIGHSQGEIAAAHVAGALSLEDAARIIALRSKALLVLAGQGGMMFVRLPEREAAAILPGELAVATVNGPTGVVVAGAPEALDRFASTCAALGVDTHRLPVDYASHSSHVESIEHRLRELAAPITPGDGRVPFYSAVDGARVDGTELDADYWYRNLRLPVRFDLATAAALADGHRIFVEVSPHPVLTWGIAEIAEVSDVDAEEVVVTGTLRRDEGGLRRFGTALAQAEVAGVAVDWSMFLDGTTPVVVDLPTYPFQRQRHWPPAPRPRLSPEGSAFWKTVASGDTAAFARLIGVADGDVPDGLVAALAKWRRAEPGDVDDRWYRIDWRAVAEAAARPLTGTWALLAEEDDVLATVLAIRMRHAGAVVEVHSEPDPARLGGFDGVVSLLAGEEGLGALAAVLPALARGRLWCVTRGGVNTGGERPDPAQAMVWGFGRVAALEHPGRWGGLADLPADPDARALDRLCALLAAGGDEDQIAIRPVATFGRRLARRTPAAGRWRPHGTVLIVGGTGAVGRALARFLAAEGAQHLLLVSRSGPGAEGADELRAELTGLGAEVSIVACDAADRQALADVLYSIPERYPLTAVVHAAMVLHDRTIEGLTAERIAEVLRPKIDVATNLHELTNARELDAFVLFSSVASITGTAGSAAYAAANAFLDALAEQRVADGLPALSIAWGLWEDTAGFAGETMRRRGLRGMDFGTALAALRAAVGGTAASVFVADIDWPRFAARFTGTRPSPLLADFATAVEVRAEQCSLATTPVSQRRRVALEMVRAHTAAVLGGTAPDAIAADRPFRELGFDSLMAVELRNRLGGAVGRTLPATLVFNHPTPIAVAELLLSLVPAVSQVEREDAPVLVSAV
uniref:type I polyketide synthase n=1 Tax=Lentzea kentuckyensis TaxID=360086 RepID=UPI00117AB811